MNLTRIIYWIWIRRQSCMINPAMRSCGCMAPRTGFPFRSKTFQIRCGMPSYRRKMRGFMNIQGVDFIRIAGAAWEDIKAGGYAEGASTISQQLIKLTHLSADKTMSRKLEEAVLAYQMEQKYSKDEILEMYLNYVYFGGGYYGIEAAAMGYFGVHASELTIAQAAMLAGILKSPTNYAPHIDLAASTKQAEPGAVANGGIRLYLIGRTCGCGGGRTRYREGTNTRIDFPGDTMRIRRYRPPWKFWAWIWIPS